MFYKLISRYGLWKLRWITIRGADEDGANSDDIYVDRPSKWCISTLSSWGIRDVRDHWQCICFASFIFYLLCSEAVVRRCYSKFVLKGCDFTKKRLQHRCFPVKFENFFNNTFLQNISGGCFCMLYFFFCL